MGEQLKFPGQQLNVNREDERICMGHSITRHDN